MNKIGPSILNLETLQLFGRFGLWWPLQPCRWQAHWYVEVLGGVGSPGWELYCTSCVKAMQAARRGKGRVKLDYKVVVVGRKRWALFPPAAAGDASDDEKLLAASARLGAAEFFDAFVPLTLEPSWRGPRPLLLTQHAGETVFVPEGFRHAVLNEELAVAVTHNVAPPSAVERMLPLAAEVEGAPALRDDASGLSAFAWHAPGAAPGRALPRAPCFPLQADALAAASLLLLWTAFCPSAAPLQVHLPSPPSP